MNIAKQIISLELIRFYESTPTFSNGSVQFCLQVFITKVIVTTKYIALPHSELLMCICLCVLM